MCSGILDTHKELFRSHSIQEPRPGQGLQHQGCVGTVSGAGPARESLLPSPALLFLTPHTITLSQKKTDPSFLASPGELWESDKGVKPKSGV